MTNNLEPQPLLPPEPQPNGAWRLARLMILVASWITLTLWDLAHEVMILIILLFIVAVLFAR